MNGCERCPSFFTNIMPWAPAISALCIIAVLHIFCQPFLACFLTTSAWGHISYNCYSLCWCVCSLADQRAQQAEERAVAAETALIDALQKLYVSKHSCSGLHDNDSAMDLPSSVTLMPQQSFTLLMSSAASAKSPKTHRRSAKSRTKKKWIVVHRVTDGLDQVLV